MSASRRPWPGLADARPQTDSACSDQLFDAVRAHELLEGLELLGCADDLEDQRFWAEVDHAGLEDVAERHQLGTALRRCYDLDEQKLALDGLARGELRESQHVDEFVHLLLDLLERLSIAIDTERDPRNVGALGRADGEALDVEAAPHEQTRDAHQNARLVLNVNRKRVAHGLCSPSTRTPARSRSRRPLRTRSDRARRPRPESSGSTAHAHRRERRSRWCGPS